MISFGGPWCEATPSPRAISVAVLTSVPVYINIIEFACKEGIPPRHDSFEGSKLKIILNLALIAATMADAKTLAEWVLNGAR